MRGIPSSILFLFFASILVIELLSFVGARMVSSGMSKKIRLNISIVYVFVSVIATGLLLYSFANPETIRQSRNYNYFSLVISLSFLNLVPKMLFAFGTAFSFLVRVLASRRWQQIVVFSSFILGTGAFFIVVYGITLGRSDRRVEKQDLYFDDLPAQLEGFRVAQISDLHLGSFGKNAAVIEDAAKIIGQLNPDILLFTGDIVNNFADEMDGFGPSLQKLTAKYGKFAILGNHDYGDYYRWTERNGKQKNLESIENGLSDAGFTLLLNEWRSIQVKDTSFALIGVENWGHRPFPQYANLDRAVSDVPPGIFRILMTHDPAHWTNVVAPETDIPLTLSGHTHGGQFGIRIAGIEFSPMYIISKTWGGLYQDGKQYLYVNRGLGTIGFSGRVEMRPEITLITLHRLKPVQVN